MGRRSNPTSGFGGLLRHLRLEQGLTQAELARLASLTPGYVAKIELGYAEPPSRDVLRRLAEALGKPVAALIESGREDQVPPEIVAAFRETPEELLWFARQTKRARRALAALDNPGDEDKRERDRIRRLARRLSNP